MTARQGLTVVGQVVGAYVGGPWGAAIGAQIGGYIGGEIDGPQKGPRLDDTSAPAVEFGARCPRAYGRVWLTLSPLWWSKLRQSTVNTGGKGAADETTDNFVYHCDMIGRLADGANVIAWTRIRIDGKIEGTQLATSSTASIIATRDSERWGDVELRTGGPTQTPWSVMEAVEGAGNVSAYRDQCTFAITDLLMPNGRNPSLIEVEVITRGTSEVRIGDGLLCHFDEMADSTHVLSALGPNLTFTAGSELSSADPRFGDQAGTSAGNFDNFQATGVTGGLDLAWRAEGWFFPTDGQASLFRLGNDGLFPTVSISLFTLFGYAAFGSFITSGGSGSGGYGTAADGLILNEWGHAAIQYDGAGELALFMNGKKVGVIDSGAIYASSDVFSTITIGNCAGKDEFYFRRIAFSQDPADQMYGDTYTIPTAPFEATNPGTVWTPEPEDLQDVLEAEMLRCAPLTIAHLDMSAAAGKEVFGFKASRSAAAECAVLLDWYYLDIFCGDTITVVERGGAVEQTIPYGYTGSGIDGTSDPFAGLIRGADVESQFATSVQYINILADGEVDTQQGQRVGTGSEVRAVNFSIYSKPTLAKGRADTITHDTRVAAHTATVRLGARQASKIQPGSVLTLVDNKGNSYRVRALRLVWNRGVYDVDVCLDDPNILSTVGITTEVDNSVIDFDPPATTETLLFDGSIFRDVDSDPGLYAFAKGSPNGATLLNSTDGGVTYSEAATFTTQSVFGTCTTVLADTSVGWMFDETNSVTVNVGAGSLSSTTRALMLADQSVNACAIGVHGRWEVMQFRTASMLSAGVYQLSGFLRGARGTEWAIPLHAAGEKFVLITTAARRVAKQANEIGIEELYKGVAAGRLASSAMAQAFTNEAVGLKPFAPVHLRVARSFDGAEFSWMPRPRYATRFASPLGIYAPLSEAIESYDVELRDGSDVLVASDTVTSPSWSVAAATTSSGLVAPAWGIKTIGGELVAIRDDQTGTYTTPKSLIRFDPADGSQIAASGVLGQEVYQWANDGDELYVATADFNNTTPTTYNNSKVKRLTRTALGSVAATYTAGVPGDIAGVACDGSNVWITERTSGNLRKLNETTLASVATYAVNAGITALYHDAGSLWIVSSETNEVIEWDIGTTTELQRFSVVSAPFDLLIVGSQVFVQGAYEVGLYDMGTGALVNSVALSAPNQLPQRTMSLFGSDVAVADLLVAKVLDSTTGAELRTIDPGTDYFFNVAGTDGTLLYLTTGAPGVSASTDGYELTALSLTGYSFIVHQNSAVVGRGYPATLEL